MEGVVYVERPHSPSASSSGGRDGPLVVISETRINSPSAPEIPRYQSMKDKALQQDKDLSPILDYKQKLVLKKKMQLEEEKMMKHYEQQQRNLENLKRQWEQEIKKKRKSTKQF